MAQRRYDVLIPLYLIPYTLYLIPPLKSTPVLDNQNHFR
jgi:hypothetical protein